MFVLYLRSNPITDLKIVFPALLLASLSIMNFLEPYQTKEKKNIISQKQSGIYSQRPEH